MRLAPKSSERTPFDDVMGVFFASPSPFPTSRSSGRRSYTSFVNYAAAWSLFHFSRNKCILNDVARRSLPYQMMPLVPVGRWTEFGLWAEHVLPAGRTLPDHVRPAGRTSSAMFGPRAEHPLPCSARGLSMLFPRAEHVLPVGRTCSTRGPNMVCPRAVHVRPAGIAC